MQITDITVSWRQQIQPREYESLAGELKVKAVLTDRSEDADAVMESIMCSLRDKIATALGRKVPTVAAVDDTAAEPMEPAPDATSQGAEPAVLAGRVDLLRVHGKPSPGKARRTKEEMAEDEAYDLAAMGDSPQPAGEAPSGVAEASDADLGDMGDMAPADDTTASLDDKALQALASSAAQKHGAEKVKEAIADQSVARLGEMTQEQRQAFKTALGKL